MKNLLYISPFLLFFSCSNEEIYSYDLSNNNNDINKLIVESFEVIDIRLQQIEGDLNKLEQKINDIDSDNSFEIDDYVYDYDKYIPHNRCIIYFYWYIITSQIFNTIYYLFN